MNSSFLYHAWGLYTHECTCEEYKSNRIILHVQAKERIRCCPCCGARSVVKNGYRLRDFVGLPMGSKRVTIRMKDNAINVRNVTSISRRKFLLPQAVAAILTASPNM